MIKSTLREIKTSLTRYLAILAIVALGVGFYAGLQMCKPDMIETANIYLRSHKFYDYQINSTYGIDDESVELARNTKGVAIVEPAIEKDVIISDNSKGQSIMKAFSIPSDINTLNVIRGELPTASNECAIDNTTLDDGYYKIGDKICIADNNDKDDKDAFVEKEFTITAFVNSPLYLDYERGSTNIGDGSVDAFFYIPMEAFDHEYYTQMYVKLDGDEYIFSNELEAKISGAEDAMDNLAKRVTAARREKERSKAQKELDDGKQEYYDGKAEYEDGLAEYNDGVKQYKSSRKSTEQQLTAAQKKIDEGQLQLNEGSAQLASQKNEIQTQLAELTQAQSAVNEINRNISNLEAAIAILPDGEEKTAYEQQLSVVQESLESIKQGLADKGLTVEMLPSLIEQAQTGLTAIEEKQLELDRNQVELNKKQAELNAGKKKSDKEFKKAKSKLDKANSELADAGKKLTDAWEEIVDGQHKIDTMEEGDSYSLSRENNIGYATFEQNANIVSNIAKIFPAFFFLVAALVCMTTMTRMMEEQRSQIGILKALGYSNRAILGKYMFYSGSAATIGAVVGFFAGCNIFPQVIWNAYTMMYDFNAGVEFNFNGRLGLACLGVALICSMGATWVSCAADFGVAPAELIRPKTPKAGKRILLERITPLWNRISFLYKVSIRNIFRYKKRFLMMVIGIAGCTALLIAGFGINTTVKGVAKFQYEEVALYDYQVVFDQDMTKADQKEFCDYARNSIENPGEIVFVHSGNTDMKVGNRTAEITLVATDDKAITNQVKLHHNNEEVAYPRAGEIAVCEKLQHQYGLNVGDTVIIQSDYDEMTVTVSGIFDNYVGEVVYMTASTYERGMGQFPETKTAFVMSPHDDAGLVHQDAAALGAYEHSSATIVNQDMISRVDSMMESLNAVIYVVILCAGLLAFIVLYNLTNINITERIREIATIKVLGFNRKETSAYVFRENVFLTAFGAFAGIPLGKWLLDFVVGNINVNMIYFVARATNLDYLYSVLLTFGFALIVNIAMQPVLRNVSMTESLKSIE